jgi:hypothetical protein
LTPYKKRSTVILANNKNRSGHPGSIIPYSVLSKPEFEAFTNSILSKFNPLLSEVLFNI